MGRTPSKSCSLPFFAEVIKPNFQKFGNLPVQVISLKSKDKGSERLSAKADNSIRMTSGHVY